MTATVLNSTSVHLSWLPPDEDQHNGDIRHYNIWIVEFHSGRVIQLNSTDFATVYTGLHPAYIYSFTVAAVTVEIGPYSDSATFRMPEDGMCISVEIDLKSFNVIHNLLKVCNLCLLEILV